MGEGRQLSINGHWGGGGGNSILMVMVLQWVVQQGLSRRLKAGVTTKEGQPHSNGNGMGGLNINDRGSVMGSSTRSSQESKGWCNYKGGSIQYYRRGDSVLMVTVLEREVQQVL